jgi:hypothetical protein
LFPFLATLTAKELRDTPANFLNDHLLRGAQKLTNNEIPEDIAVPYILSPHIEWELIQPWRWFFNAVELNIDAEAESIINYINESIKINDTDNYYNCRITPRGVFELQIADRPSRDIYFVALCRYLGIPARIETATGKPQYFKAGQWIDAIFNREDLPTSHLPKAKLTLRNTDDNIINPGYYTHYTLAYFQDGDFQTLDFENNPLVAEFPFQLELAPGYYRLMAGSRANDGSVSVHTQYFVLEENKSYTLNVRLPETKGKLFVKGIVDMNTIVSLNENTSSTLKQLSKGKGLMLCFVDVGKEPSKHILQDLPAVKQSLDEWGGSVLFMTPNDKVTKGFNASTFGGLPENTVWGIDGQRKLLQTVADALQIEFQDNFPLTVYLSSNGGILYSSVGYRIGAGEKILEIIWKEGKP